MPDAATGMPTGHLQEGIYIERGKPPPAAWRTLFLDIADGTAPAAAREAIAAVMRMLAELKAGRARDLAAERPEEDAGVVPADSFTVLIGYGASLFDPGRHDPPLTAAARPRHLVSLRQAGEAFPNLPWREGAAQSGNHDGEADLLLQFTAASEQAAARAAVEVAKLIEDDGLPLRTAGSHSGFQRDDGRSWIGFHDGVTNIEPSQRLAAITCPGDPGWNQGGTYLAFLRLQVDLRLWRGIGRAEQEAIVGRDKLSGWPLGAIERTEDGLRPRPIGSGPLSEASDWRERDAYFNPPETTDPLVEASHIHRANQARAAGGTPAGERIFRQGYEYLEGIGPDGPRLGLNFVSFQSDLQHLKQVLGLSGWLGDVNFGGPSNPGAGDPKPPALLSLVAGGFYAVPPRHDPFPGAALLSTAEGPRTSRREP
jgi:deferrochelatase/peroxidase EfeB